MKRQFRTLAPISTGRIEEQKRKAFPLELCSFLKLIDGKGSNLGSMRYFWSSYFPGSTSCLYRIYGRSLRKHRKGEPWEDSVSRGRGRCLSAYGNVQEAPHRRYEIYYYRCEPTPNTLSGFSIEAQRNPINPDPLHILPPILILPHHER